MDKWIKDGSERAHTNTHRPRGKWLDGFGLKICMSSLEIHKSKCVSRPPLGSFSWMYIREVALLPVSRQQCILVVDNANLRPGGGISVFFGMVFPHKCRSVIQCVDRGS